MCSLVNRWFHPVLSDLHEKRNLLMTENVFFHFSTKFFFLQYFSSHLLVLQSTYVFFVLLKSLSFCLRFVIFNFKKLYLVITNFNIFCFPSPRGRLAHFFVGQDGTLHTPYVKMISLTKVCFSLTNMRTE